MRILYFLSDITRPSKGAAGCTSHNTFTQRAFRKLGHEVSVISVREDADGQKASLDVKWRVYDVVRNLFPSIITDWLRDLYTIYSDRRCYKIISERIKTEKPDMIFERFSQYHMSGARAAKENRIAYVVEIHSPPEERLFHHQRLNFGRYYRRVQAQVARTADIVVVVSSYFKQYLMDQRISEGKILVVPNAIDPEIFHPTGKGSVLRGRLGISEKIVVGFVGTMAPWHGLHLLPDICAIVKRKVPDICFMLVGNFETQRVHDKYYQQLRQEGVEDYFILTGGVPVESVPEYIEAMDICLVPGGTNYGCPIKIFEYGALAKPCVVARYGPVEEVLHNGSNALLFEPKSIGDMAAKIVRLARDKNLRLQLGRQLNKDVLSEHTWTKNVERILNKLFEEDISIPKSICKTSDEINPLS